MIGKLYKKNEKEENQQQQRSVKISLFHYRFMLIRAFHIHTG